MKNNRDYIRNHDRKPFSDDDILKFAENPTLSEKEKICFKNYYLSNCTYREIGDKLGISTERVRQLVIRACRKNKLTMLPQRKKIRENYAKYIWADDIYHLETWLNSHPGYTIVVNRDYNGYVKLEVTQINDPSASD